MRDSILLIAAALAAFGLSVTGSFHFDDYSLFSDPNVTAWWATRPLTNLTFRLNELAGGRNPMGYHLLNLLLHVASVLLLRSGLSRVIPASIAWMAALVFAVHPIEAEPVNYIFARGTLLATLLCILSLNSWVSGRHWVAVAWYAAALLSKEECTAFPVFLLLLHLSISRNRRELAPIGTMFALTLAAGLRVVLATGNIAGTGVGFGSRTTPAEYLSLEGIAILRYLWLVIAPWGFSVDTQLWQPAMWGRVAAWVAVAGLAGAALRWFDRARPGLWFLGALVLLLPSSSIFPADDYAADRRMYLPMIALSVVLAFLLDKLDRRVAAAVIVVWIAISVRYTLVWRTEKSLWTEAADRAPGKVRPRLQLARTASTPEEALAVLAKAETIAPGDPDVASEKGRVYLTLNRAPEALASFGRALALAPDDAAALSNRGVALAALGQTEAARQDFERALQKNPCLFDARMNLKRTGASPPPPPANCRYTAEQQAELTR